MFFSNIEKFISSAVACKSANFVASCFLMCLEVSPAYFEVIYHMKLVRKVYCNIVHTYYLHVNLPYPQVVLYVQ